MAPPRDTPTSGAASPVARPIILDVPPPTDDEQQHPEPTEQEPQQQDPVEEQPPEADDDAMAKTRERMDRFKALRARRETSTRQNLAAATREAKRLTAAPGQLVSLGRKRDAAAAKLERADIEAAGEDFERRRAWDWTVDESEAWDRRVRRAEARRDNAAFTDHTAEAHKAYRRQVRQSIMPSGQAGDAARERYQHERAAAVERAAASGGLEVVETEDGELVAVDRDGTFYSTADSLALGGSGGGAGTKKPDKAAVDRLVADLQKAEDARLRKRKERLAATGEDGGDVTYINEKNKQFNLKLARFYNKYTTEVRESFERGTMI